jgi:hypothetical protein
MVAVHIQQLLADNGGAAVAAGTGVLMFVFWGLLVLSSIFAI